MIQNYLLHKDKYTFYQKLFQTEFVDIIETKNFTFLRFFVFHILFLKN